MAALHHSGWAGDVIRPNLRGSRHPESPADYSRPRRPPLRSLACQGGSAVPTPHRDQAMGSRGPGDLRTAPGQPSATCTDPRDGKAFDGVLGKDLSNPVPSCRPPPARRRWAGLSVFVGDDMDAPNPDSGEGVLPHEHTVVRHLDEQNRFAGGDNIQPPNRRPRVRHRRWTAS